MSEEFCFVIMPFKEELRLIYKLAIKKAVEDAGLKCIRTDEDSSPASILREIVEYIHGAKVIIADLTEQNPNVFYELGIAHSLGKNVIVLAQKMDEVPFDVRSYKVIKYENKLGGDHELKEKIQEAIKAMRVWAAKSNNPVQDFLPSEARPIPAGMHKSLQDEFAAAKAEALRLQEEKHAIQKDRDEKSQAVLATKTELEALKQEMAQLQGMKKLADAMSRFMEREMPEFGADEFEHFMEEMGKQGDVTVSVAPPEDHPPSSGGGAKIKFTRVNQPKKDTRK